MRAAFYEKDITPPLGGFITGSYMDIRAQDVKDPLFVRSVVIDNEKETVAVIEIDACEIPDDLHDAVTGRIHDYTGIKPQNVLVSVNHTHRGIPISDSPEINAYADSSYKDVAYRLIADCVILAYRRLYDADLSFGLGRAEGIAFNRTFIMKDGTYQTNVHKRRDEIKRPMAGVDEDVPVLFVRDKNGKVKGALISFACHQDVVEEFAYSGGFSYVMSRELKKKYGDDFISVFVSGASGDINHFDLERFPMPSDTYIKMGKVLSETVISACENAEPLKDDTLVSKKEIIKIKKRPYNKESLLSDIEQFVKMGILTQIRNITFYAEANKEDEADVYLQCIKVGDVLIYAYSGEIFVHFGLELKKAAPSEKVIIATQANRGCGYVPTREAFDENSRLYEKSLCFHACLDKEAGYIMNRKLLEMSKDI